MTHLGETQNTDSFAGMSEKRDNFQCLSLCWRIILNFILRNIGHIYVDWIRAAHDGAECLNVQ